MSVAYRQAQLSKYRITLEISALEDFNPHQIDWEKLFKLEGKERCEAYVEDLNVSWESIRNCCALMYHELVEAQSNTNA